jgi:hypothetical protein
MYVDSALLDEGSVGLVDYPCVELAEHSCSVEAVEHLHLDELVDQRQQHLILLQNVCPHSGQRYQPSSVRSYLKMQYYV